MCWNSALCKINTNHRVPLDKTWLCRNTNIKIRSYYVKEEILKTSKQTKGVLVVKNIFLVQWLRFRSNYNIAKFSLYIYIFNSVFSHFEYSHQDSTLGRNVIKTLQIDDKTIYEKDVTAGQERGTMRPWEKEEEYERTKSKER